MAPHKSCLSAFKPPNISVAPVPHSEKENLNFNEKSKLTIKLNLGLKHKYSNFNWKRDIFRNSLLCQASLEKKIPSEIEVATPHKLLSLLILLTLLYGFIGCGAKSGSGGLDWTGVECSGYLFDCGEY